MSLCVKKPVANGLKCGTAYSPYQCQYYLVVITDRILVQRMDRQLN